MADPARMYPDSSKAKCSASFKNYSEFFAKKKTSQGELP